MKGLGLGRLKNLDAQNVFVVRYQGSARGHGSMSTSNSCQVLDGRPRITGDRSSTAPPRCRLTRRYMFAIDDATRLATSKCCWMSRRRRTVGFLARPSAGSLSRGDHLSAISQNHGASYALETGRKAFAPGNLKPSAPSPYTPQTNGKANVFIKTIRRNGLTWIATKHRIERNRWLPRYLGIYTRQQVPHGSSVPHASAMPPAAC